MPTAAVTDLNTHDAADRSHRAAHALIVELTPIKRQSVIATSTKTRRIIKINHRLSVRRSVRRRGGSVAKLSSSEALQSITYIQQMPSGEARRQTNRKLTTDIIKTQFYECSDCESKMLSPEKTVAFGASSRPMATFSARQAPAHVAVCGRVVCARDVTRYVRCTIGIG